MHQHRRRPAPPRKRRAARSALEAVESEAVTGVIAGEEEPVSIGHIVRVTGIPYARVVAILARHRHTGPSAPVDWSAESAPGVDPNG